ncbi:L,D-transpeptidase [Sphingomonas quercus]|uniref:L,D-transpeptidase n=1 Tax=Sphingomonas quercus TaxID=2842451 RepID=A0ABS6BML6_9SPHN|nr:L,D-transpeptidase [Sphingomonas quercus]MBU3078445.1 L,D-transpeptidase [Sphingomonas quercus]
MRLPLPLLLILGLAAQPLAAQPQTLTPAQPVTIEAVINALKPGQYLWAPQLAPAGPMMIVVSLAKQRAYIYRNGVIIGVSTISSGKAGKATPTGVFTILQKKVDHKSNLYNDAPMPYMQRLTWDGIAMHAGNLPGYPASHGCIRLPLAFAKLLYAETSFGLTVVITNDAPIPRLTPTPAALTGAAPAAAPAQPGQALVRWTPEKAPTGPLSIIISGADHRLIVLRNGIEIGSTPVSFSEPVALPAAYVLKNVDADGAHWLTMSLPWDKAAASRTVTPEERAKLALPEDFRLKLLAILEPGATVVVTPDTLRAGSTGKPITVIAEQ